MTRATAERVIQGLLSASGALNDTVRQMQEEASEAEFRDHRSRTGHVMAAIYLDLIKPIVKFYPDLDQVATKTFRTIPGYKNVSDGRLT